MTVTWMDCPSDPTYSQQGHCDSRPPWIVPSKPSSIQWAAKQTIAPTIEPMTLTGAKVGLRVDTSDEDDLISNLITAAREYVELRTQLALMTQTWVLQLDRFPRSDRVELWPTAANPLGCILLPKHPVASVTGITWTDQNGGVNTVDPTTY